MTFITFSLQNDANTDDTFTRNVQWVLRTFLQICQVMFQSLSEVLVLLINEKAENLIFVCNWKIWH